MTARAFRCQVRLNLSDLDRGVYGEQTIALAQHPDEPDEHILLRFLFWVFFYEEGLSDAHGWTERNAPDVLGTDLTGDTTLWGEAGVPPIKRLVKAVSRHKRARIIGLFADPKDAADLHRQVKAARVREPRRVELMMVAPELMERLEEIGNRNMSWNATITEGELYLECDGELLQGRLTAWDAESDD